MLSPHPSPVGEGRILVIDSDAEYAEMMCTALRRDASEVAVANSVRTAVGHLRGSAPGVVIIDYGLEGSPTPLEFADALRRVQPEIGLVFTSEARLSVVDVLACFRAGGDEYIEKPFHPIEFAARVSAVARRARPSLISLSDESEDDARDPASWFQFDESRRVVSYDGRALNLTETEFQLLAELHRSVGSIVPYADLNGRVLGVENEREPGLRMQSSAPASKHAEITAGPSCSKVRMIGVDCSVRMRRIACCGTSRSSDVLITIRSAEDRSKNR
jgi:DNA-binding response OmpR family regulator